MSLWLPPPRPPPHAGEGAQAPVFIAEQVELVRVIPAASSALGSMGFGDFGNIVDTDRMTPLSLPAPDMTQIKPEYPPIRRLVTGHDAHSVAKVLMDGAATNWKSSSPGSVSTLIWSTDGTPADISVGEEIEDLGARILGTAPPANGTRFAVIDFPPGNTGRMHRTETIDYVIVIAGEIDMDMDESTVHLRAGDVMVQRGTNHAWVNRGTAPARLAFVLIDAKPLGIGHPVVGSASPR